jgi:uncharacterized integral membrane protein
MNEEFDDIQPNPEKKPKKKRIAPDEPLETPKFDMKAAHRKVMIVMIGIFLLILALMLLMQNHVEFAATGGM